jgi:hypothetical protein
LTIYRSINALAESFNGLYKWELIHRQGPVVSPDEFLLDQLDLAPRIVLDVLREQAAHTRRPPLTPTDLLARLARAGLPAFADEADRMI